MATIRDEAICIRHWDFSETSQTVGLFCRTQGMLRGLAKGARRERGSFSGGFDLFTRGEMVAITKPGRELATLTEWSLLETFPVLRRSAAANRAAWYFADLIGRFMHLPDPHPRSWDALVLGLKDLESGVDSARTILAFQWTLLDDLGYRPRIDLADLNEDTVAFDPHSGQMVADTGTADRWRVRSTTAKLLNEIELGMGVVPGESIDESITRANRLLGAWIRELTGRDSVPMQLMFKS